MSHDGMAWGILGMIAVVLLLGLFLSLSPNARLRRRLRKTHSRIISKAPRPSVKLSVKPPKDER
jgi:hypothetical protein